MNPEDALLFLKYAKPRAFFLLRFLDATTEEEEKALFAQQEGALKEDPAGFAQELVDFGRRGSRTVEGQKGFGLLLTRLAFQLLILTKRDQSWSSVLDAVKAGNQAMNAADIPVALRFQGFLSGFSGTVHAQDPSLEADKQVSYLLLAWYQSLLVDEEFPKLLTAEIDALPSKFPDKSDFWNAVAVYAFLAAYLIERSVKNERLLPAVAAANEISRFPAPFGAAQFLHFLMDCEDTHRRSRDGIALFRRHRHTLLSPNLPEALNLWAENSLESLRSSGAALNAPINADAKTLASDYKATCFWLAEQLERSARTDPSLARVAAAARRDAQLFAEFEAVRLVAGSLGGTTTWVVDKLEDKTVIDQFAEFFGAVVPKIIRGESIAGVIPAYHRLLTLPHLGDVVRRFADQANATKDPETADQFGTIFLLTAREIQTAADKTHSLHGAAQTFLQAAELLIPEKARQLRYLEFMKSFGTARDDTERRGLLQSHDTLLHEQHFGDWLGSFADTISRESPRHGAPEVWAAAYVELNKGLVELAGFDPTLCTAERGSAAGFRILAGDEAAPALFANFVTGLLFQANSSPEIEDRIFQAHVDLLEDAGWASYLEGTLARMGDRKLPEPMRLARIARRNRSKEDDAASRTVSIITRWDAAKQWHKMAERSPYAPFIEAFAKAPEARRQAVVREYKSVLQTNGFLDWLNDWAVLSQKHEAVEGDLLSLLGELGKVMPRAEDPLWWSVSTGVTQAMSLTFGTEQPKEYQYVVLVERWCLAADGEKAILLARYKEILEDGAFPAWLQGRITGLAKVPPEATLRRILTEKFVGLAKFLSVAARSNPSLAAAAAAATSAVRELLSSR